ncbi:uncharacterized protein TRIVIDRAFT_216512, partial [Trichoderma virens Gv29-8]
MELLARACIWPPTQPSWLAPSPSQTPLSESFSVSTVSSRMIWLTRGKTPQNGRKAADQRARLILSMASEIEANKEPA